MNDDVPEPLPGGASSPDGPDQVASVARAIAILECFETAEQLGVSEIARRIGTAKSTAARLVLTLQRAGLVEQDPDTRQYLLGLRLADWGQLTAHRHDLGAAARTVLCDLASETGLTAAIVVPTRRGVLHLERAEAAGTTAFWSHHGKAFPKTGAGGIVMMAARAGRPRSRARSDADETEVRVRRAQESGYAVEWGHVISGTASVAVPIRRLGETQAAIAFIGDSRTLRSQTAVADLVALAVRSARLVEAASRPQDV